MQFGIFSVGDVTTDPTTGTTQSEHERIEGMVALALKAEEVGLDVFATGEHHNPPFVPSSPTTMLGFIAAQTERIILSTAVLRGTYHLYQGFGAFVGNFAMGVLFGWLYTRYGRLLPLVIAHTLIDTAIFVGYPWAAATFPGLFGH